VYVYGSMGTHVAAGDHEGALVCSVNIDYFSVILVEYL
jgi:hypothetical protein